MDKGWTRTALLALGLLVAPAAGWAQETGAPLTEAQKKAIDGLIGDYLKRHPEAVIEAIRAFQAREQAAKERRARANLTQLKGELERDPASPVAGNPKGDVTVVEFFDYRCTFCKRVLPAVRRLLRDDPRIRYVFKEFPILTPQSRIAARAALAAWRVAPETYFGFHVDLMSARGALGEAVILRLAANAGLDTQRLKREMQSPEIEAVLRRNAEIAQRLGIQGTPAFIIGERLVPGAIDLAQLQSLVAEARGR